MVKVHRAILKDSKNNTINEVRYYNGIMYKQNRSYDISMCFDDFIDRCKTTKKQASKVGSTLVCDIIDKNTLWSKLI